MSTNLNIRVPKQLMADFDMACQDNYTNKSEVLRRAMLDYVKQNQKGEEKMKVIKMNQKGHEKLDAVTYFYLADLKQDEVATYVVNSEPFLHGNHLRIDFHSNSGPYTRPMDDVLADNTKEIIERLVEFGVIAEVEMVTGRIGYERGPNYENAAGAGK